MANVSVLYSFTAPVAAGSSSPTGDDGLLRPAPASVARLLVLVPLQQAVQPPVPFRWRWPAVPTSKGILTVVCAPPLETTVVTVTLSAITRGPR
jgi:hypothetical protein